MTYMEKGPFTMKRESFIFGISLAGALFVDPNTAVAQQTNDDTYDLVRKEKQSELADQKTNAADKLVEQGDLVGACRQYEIADRLDPNLIRKGAAIACLEKLGHYADAYYRMQKIARETNDEQIRRDAMAEANRIKGKAPCIFIDVPESVREIPNLEVSIDGQVIPKDSWEKTCTPVNLGDHTITAKAPSRGWAPQKHSVMAPETQYRVTIQKPSWTGQIPAPAKPENPVNRAAFLIPSAILSAVGIGCLVYAYKMPNEKDAVTPTIAGYSFLSGAVAALGSGTIVYVVAEPNDSATTKQARLPNVTIGLTGRF
jgi:hypothetical protein